jgi:hypothetical protein
MPRSMQMVGVTAVMQAMVTAIIQHGPVFLYDPQTIEGVCRKNSAHLLK